MSDNIPRARVVKDREPNDLDKLRDDIREVTGAIGSSRLDSDSKAVLIGITIVCVAAIICTLGGIWLAHR